MAQIITDEGLDFLIDLALKNNEVAPTSLWMGLFTSQTASTVPARTATGGAAPSGWTEATGTSYARVEITAAEWGANSTSGNGRATVAAQQTFPTVGAGGWGTVNGFFIATNSASGAGDVVLMFANFDDVTGNPLNETDIQRVTPTVRFDGQ